MKSARIFQRRNILTQSDKSLTKAIILLTQTIVSEDSNILKRLKLALDPRKLCNSGLQFVLSGTMRGRMVVGAKTVNGASTLLNTSAVGAVLLQYLTQFGVARRRGE